MAQEIKPILTAVFVDYDNIYLSLRRRNEDAAKRFAKDATSWIKEVEAGRLMTATNSPSPERPRRIVLNRCYGNPVPRRNQSDNSTDMNSFPFVRHHFLRAGFEVVDCPPLTAQLKNSSDIRMVMDVRDFLTHDTRFEEFVILSGDADFTPVLHRLRAHARRTVIYANDYTAAPYTAICDAEIRENNLLTVLTAGKVTPQIEQPAAITVETSQDERTRIEILAAVTAAVRSAGGPVPLEALAERTTRALGHDRTVGSSWAGAGSFLELLRQSLPEDIKLTDQPPYMAYEAKRGIAQSLTAQAKPAIEARQPERIEPALPPPAPRQKVAASIQQPIAQQPAAQPPIAQPATLQAAVAAPAPRAELPQMPIAAPIAAPVAAPAATAAPATSQPIAQAPQPVPAQRPPQRAPQQTQAEAASAIQQSIARIHDACQAPPLAPPEYRAVFELIAREINEQGLQGSQTLNNVMVRAQEVGIKLNRDDIRFIMEVVSEADPWFEQGASAGLFAGRFRNYVVARCRAQGLNLSSSELDLVDAWFAGSSQAVPPQRVPAGSAEVAPQSKPGSLWSEPAAPEQATEEFPKILRTRLRG